MCDCASKAPTYPVYRTTPHLLGCPEAGVYFARTEHGCVRLVGAAPDAVPFRQSGTRARPVTEFCAHPRCDRKSAPERDRCCDICPHGHSLACTAQHEDHDEQD